MICTATQPALADNDFKDGLPLTPERELAPDPKTLAVEFRRTRIVKAGPMTNDDLVDALGDDALGDTDQGLVIVNSRKHALDLYHAARDADLAGVIHLSTRQYAAHRQAILADVRDRLTNNRPCRLIATSLVEAGVDIDFPRVWRAQAGLDQIAQANGRCNREGRRPVDDSVLTVFEAVDYPPPKELRQFAEVFEMHVAEHFPDWLSPDAMAAYFLETYWRRDQAGALDAHDILGMTKINGAELDFAYRTIADKFTMIEDGMAPVIIARDKPAQDALKRLDLADTRPGSVARALQRYIVQIPPRARNRLIANGHIEFRHSDRWGDQFAVLTNDRLYTPEDGLRWEDAGDVLGNDQLMF